MHRLGKSDGIRADLPNLSLDRFSSQNVDEYSDEDSVGRNGALNPPTRLHRPVERLKS